MSDDALSGSGADGGGCGCLSIWFLPFILIKLMGTTLAAWSWWWLFIPIVPCLWLILDKLSLLH